jgi:tRNA A-37 threonylcarbamoyl transferase component Bud32
MNIRITFNRIHPELEAFVHALPSSFERGGENIHRQRNEIKVFRVGGVSVNVKRYKTPRFPNRIIYTFFRPSKAERAYRYAFRIRALGFDTPEPVACILISEKGLLHTAYYVSLHVPDEHTMREFGTGGMAGRESILREFAEYTAKLHEAGIYHRDYSPGNILFRREGGRTRFCLVDINRMRFGRVSVKKGCAAFARLWGPEAIFRLLAENYAGARSANAAQCIRLTLHFRKSFWKAYVRKYALPFEEDTGTSDHTP